MRQADLTIPHTLSLWFKERSSEKWAVRLFLLALIGYVLAYSFVSSYKFATYRQGFDLAQNEQTIWNTAHGRWFESSPFVVLRYDFDDGPVPLELVLAIPYALIPTTYTLLVLQTLALAAGAIPIFWIAREKLNPWLGLLFALAYLFHVTVTRINLYEFQLRAFVIPFFLFSFFYFEKNKFGRFLLFAFLTLACKTEVALTLPMFGVYGLLTHKSPRWILTPVVMGVVWFGFAFGYVVPTFAPSNFITGVYGYSWLGAGFGEMLRTVVTRPGYVLENVLTPDKLEYLFQSFLLLLFLPLLRPWLLLFALPNLAQNLLAMRSVQYSVLYFYQPFVVGAFFLAAVYGVAETLPRLAGTRTRVIQTTVLVILFLASVLFNATWHNLALQALKRGEPLERRAAAEHILAQLPPDAAVAASSFLGPHVAQRQELYFFPGTTSYPFPADRVQYIVADLTENTDPESSQGLAWLRASKAWQLVAEEQGFALYRASGSAVNQPP